MCDPVTIAAGATAAIGIGSSIASHEAAEDRAEATRKAARESFDSVITDINAREVEVREQASRSIFQAERQARSAMALERVSQGEAGVAGISAEAVRRDIERDAAEFKTTTEDQTEGRTDQLGRRKLSARQIMENRIAGAPGPSNLGLALNIGASLAKGGAMIASAPSSPDTG